MDTVASATQSPYLTIELEGNDLCARLLMHGGVNYALAHAQISPVLGIEIENRSEAALEGGLLELSFQSPLDRPIAQPLRRRLPTVEPGETRFVSLLGGSWHVDPVALAVVEEAVAGRVEVRLSIDGVDPLVEHAVMQVLARDEWWAPISELVAAFVAPRDTTIGTIVAEASALLKQRTDDPSIQGYQAGRDRVLAIAEAVYDAMRARQVRYQTAPPSFEGTGQKIRRPLEVFDDRVGNCLDLATSYSAALEACGLHPLVFLGEGHAFAGFLTAADQLDELVMRDPGKVTNRVDVGAIVPVETTALCDGNSTSFRDAVAAAGAHGWWSHSPESLEGVVDVRAAHRNGVRPLPNVTHGVDGIVVEVERTPAPDHAVPGLTASAASTSMLPSPAAPSAKGGERQETTFPPRVARWRNSLLDLSLRNPLLNMSTRGKGVDLHVPAGKLGDLEDMVFDGDAIRLLPHDDIADIHKARGARTAQDMDAETLGYALMSDKSLYAAVTEQTYARKLRDLQRASRTVLEETGANNLFLTLGTLRWNEGTRDLRSPLFLLPVKLTAQRRGPYRITVDDGAFTLPNQCLVEKLRSSLNMAIPEFEQPELDDSGIDLTGSIAAIRRALIERELPWTVEEESRLAILQFSTLELWQDLSENWEHFLRNPVVRHLVETPTDAFADPVLEAPHDPLVEATAFCPIPVDGSQLQAVEMSGHGRSFVLEGPPGTGKSQTITNVIAHALANGKRVLFVAEKAVALDVVKRRLDAVGLGDLCLDLHGKHQSPAEVRGQLSRALKRQAAGNAEAWEQIQSRFGTMVTSLGRYPSALHEIGPAGFSAWTARQALLTAGEGPTIEVSRQVVTGGTSLDEAYSHARELSASLFDLGSSLDDHPWSLATITDISDPMQRDAVVAAVTDLERAVTMLGEGRLRGLLASSATDELLATIGALAESVREGVADEPLDAAALDGVRADDWPTRVEELRARRRRLLEDASNTLARMRPNAIMRSDLDEILVRAKAADGAFFLTRGKARKRVAEELAGDTIDPQTNGVAPDQLTPTLELLITYRAAARTWRDLAAGVPGLSLGADVDPFDETVLDRIEARAAYAERVRHASQLVGADALDAAALAELHGDEGEAAGLLLDAWRRLVASLKVDDESLRRWRGKHGLLEAVERGLPAWREDAAGTQLLALVRWARVRSHVTGLRSLGLGGVVDALRAGDIRADDVEDVTRRSLATAALEERLTLPALAGFDGAERDRRIEEFRAHGSVVRAEMLSELPATVVNGRTFDPARMVGKAGELNRQLSRQRGGMKIRELMEKFGSIIGEITPCLLMSPHSVARFLPPGAMDIDLVVFDEASQIRVEQAVGAMGRASAVVIAGDSKQMPPSSFGRAGADEDEETDTRFESLPADMESVLSEAVESQLPQLWLSWHYRSQDESLIAFSNVNYYEERLASFPSPPEPREGFGVSLRRVGGTFDRTGGRRINDAEIDAVIAEIRVRLAADPHASIGVITMNAQQLKEFQNRFDSMAEAGTDKAITAALAREHDKLFVKNLENVQGDEADTILFSLAFSPNPETNTLSLNFGPLTTAGGERRLNVAITRARRDVVLFTSFEPSHIDLRRTSSVGMAHLRAYMEMADRGVEASGVVRPIAARDRHRDHVVEELREAGLVVQTGIGLSEFTVDIAAALTEDGPWVAVFLDGPGYAKRASVGDRETIGQTVLAGSMGWSRVERVWMPSWLAEPDAVIDRIVAAAKMPRPEPPEPELQLELEPTEDAADGEPEGAIDNSAAVTIEPPHPSELHPLFVPARDGVYAGDKSVLDMLSSHNARALVLDQINDIVAAEAPIEGLRLARIVARRFDLNRLAAKRAAEILAVVPSSMRRKTSYGVFVWADGQDPATYEGFRVPGPGETRDILEIAPEELINAMRYIADVAHGISVDDLLRETASLFGVKRLATKVRPRLEDVLERAMSLGQLHNDAGFIVAPAVE